MIAARYGAGLRKLQRKEQQLQARRGEQQGLAGRQARSRTGSKGRVSPRDRAAMRGHSGSRSPRSRQPNQVSVSGSRSSVGSSRSSGPRSPRRLEPVYPAMPNSGREDSRPVEEQQVMAMLMLVLLLVLVARSVLTPSLSCSAALLGARSLAGLYALAGHPRGAGLRVSAAVQDDVRLPRAVDAAGEAPAD